MPELVLASASPRRHELLARLVSEFDVLTSDAEDRGDQTAPPRSPDPLLLPPGFNFPPDRHPALWAWRKASDVAARNALSPDTLVLGADTTVINESAALGKPRDNLHAAEMLRSLRGRHHFVATGVVLLAAGPPPITLFTGSELTRVTMRDFSDNELTRYVASGESQDKAGAYALQGMGGSLISEVKGCVTNVVGLPLCLVRSALWEARMPLLEYPHGGYCAYCPLRSVSR